MSLSESIEFTERRKDEDGVVLNFYAAQKFKTTTLLCAL